VGFFGEGGTKGLIMVWHLERGVKRLLLFKAFFLKGKKREKVEPGAQ